MRRVVLKSPVLENCTPGSVRGALGNQRPYLAKLKLEGQEVSGKAEIGKAECAVVKSNGLEGESPSGLAESRRSLERKN